MKLDRLFLLLALLPSAAIAQSPDAGFYLGGAFGQSKLEEWCTGASATAFFNSCEDTDIGWKVLGGYRFNRYVAAEASYNNWGEVTANVTVSGVVNDVAAEQHSYGLAVVGTLPLGPGFELFGKAGFLRTEQETRRDRQNLSSTVNRHETELHYGLGAKYAFTKNWALRGEWEKTEKLKLEMLSIGVEYRF